MSTSFVISIPKDELELRDEIEEQLAAYAKIHDAPRSFDLNEIKMIVEIVAGTTSILANGTAIIMALLALKDRFKKQGKKSGLRIAVPGKDDVVLDDVDEAILKKMLGLEK